MAGVVRGLVAGLSTLVVGLSASTCGAPDRSPDSNPPAEPPAATDPSSHTTTRGETDLIRLTSPLPDDTVSSPLVLRGEARGNWYFEASFPVVLTDWDGRIIAEHYATAQGEWMTTEFVPFETVIEFTVPDDIGDFSRRGSLILQKDNASGLPEFDDALEITVFFAR
jgi:hypothetical protein